MVAYPGFTGCIKGFRGVLPVSSVCTHGIYGSAGPGRVGTGAPKATAFGGYLHGSISGVVVAYPRIASRIKGNRCKSAITRVRTQSIHDATAPRVISAVAA